jgi:hypothetical protein
MFWGCPTPTLGRMQIINPILVPPGRLKWIYFETLIFLKIACSYYRVIARSVRRDEAISR